MDFMMLPSERHFELKLEEKLASLPFNGSGGKHIFTESLILAQDERWRRA
jgi:hypothetical protein